MIGLSTPYNFRAHPLGCREKMDKFTDIFQESSRLCRVDVAFLIKLLLIYICSCISSNCNVFVITLIDLTALSWLIFVLCIFNNCFYFQYLYDSSLFFYYYMAKINSIKFYKVLYFLLMYNSLLYLAGSPNLRMKPPPRRESSLVRCPSCSTFLSWEYDHFL